MAYGGLNLGNIASALRATGQNPELADQLEGEVAAQTQAPASTVAPSPIGDAATMNQALEATGSSYRVPQNAAGNAYGAIEPGNLDLSRRPYVKNDDGSISTVRSMGVNIDGKEYLIPTVSKDGRVMSDDEAVDTFMKTGEHMGVYASPQASTAAGDAIHEDQMRTPPLPWRDGLPENPYNYGEGGAQAPAPPPQIEDTPINPRAGARQLRAESTAASQRALDLATEKGDIAAEGAARQAEELGALRETRRAGREQAAGRVGMNREQKDKLEREMFAKLDQISEDMKNPPKDTMALVMGIIGAALSLGGRGGAASAVQALGGLIGSKTKQWEQGLEADKEKFKGMRDLYNLQNDDSLSELDIESKLATLAVGETDAALKQIIAETDSKEFKRLAEDARNGMRQKWAEHQADVGARQNASAADDAILRAIAGAPSPEQARAIALQFGSRGEKLLGRLQKLDAGQLDIEAKRAGVGKTQAEIDELEAKAAATGPGRLRDQLKVQGLTPLEGATPQDKSKAQEIVVAQNNLDQALGIMQKLQGSADPNDKKTYDIQWKLAIGSLNSLANAGVLNPGELEDWREKMPKHMYDNIGPLATPKAALVDEERVLGDMRDIFRKKSESGLRTYNYAYAPGEGAHGTEQASPGQAGRATPTAASRGVTRDARGGFALPATNVNITPEELAGIPSDWLQPSGAVQMVNAQTGAVKTVAPQYVEAYERAGWRRPQPAPAPQAGNGQS